MKKIIEILKRCIYKLKAVSILFLYVFLFILIFYTDYSISNNNFYRKKEYW